VSGPWDLKHGRVTRGCSRPIQSGQCLGVCDGIRPCPQRSAARGLTVRPSGRPPRHADASPLRRRPQLPRDRAAPAGRRPPARRAAAADPNPGLGGRAGPGRARQARARVPARCGRAPRAAQGALGARAAQRVQVLRAAARRVAQAVPGPGGHELGAAPVMLFPQPRQQAQRSAPPAGAAQKSSLGAPDPMAMLRARHLYAFLLLGCTSG